MGKATGRSCGINTVSLYISGSNIVFANMGEISGTGDARYVYIYVVDEAGYVSEPYMIEITEAAAV